MSVDAWHTDPSGRYAQRYYDGAQWTQHVADAEGRQSQDPQPVEAVTKPAGALATATAPAPTPASSAGMPAQPPVGAATGASSPSGFRVTPGLILAGAGLVAVALSQFALNWLESSFFALDRAEIGELVGFMSSAGLSGAPGADEALNTVTDLYFSVGWILTMVAVAAALATTFVSALRVPAAVSCGVMAAWHLFVMIDISEGLEDLAVGSWVGLAGLAAGLMGALVTRSAR